MNPIDLQTYRTLDLQVVEVSGQELVFIAGDDSMVSNSLVRLTHEGDSAWARVIAQEGTRHVRAQLLHALPWLVVGAKVDAVSPNACLPQPVSDAQVGSLSYQPEGVPFQSRKLDLSDISGVRTPLATGWELLDSVVPLARGGINLVIDQSGGRGFEALTENLGESPRIWVNEAHPGDFSVSGESDYERWMAFRVATAWAADLRQSGTPVTVLGRLPRMVPDEFLHAPEKVQSLNRLTHDLFEPLASSKSTDITTVLALVLDPEDPVGAIVETLSLGHFDAQVFVDGEGCVDLLKSSSSVELSPDLRDKQSRVFRTLSQVKGIQEKTAIFGDDDLDESERQAMAESESLVVNLWSHDQRS